MAAGLFKVALSMDQAVSFVRKILPLGRGSVLGKGSFDSVRLLLTALDDGRCLWSTCVDVRRALIYRFYLSTMVFPISQLMHRE